MTAYLWVKVIAGTVLLICAFIGGVIQGFTKGR